MTDHRKLTFVAAVNDRSVLAHNLLTSFCLRSPNVNEIVIQEGFPSAAKAYNDAIAKSRNDLLVFVHQDIIFPEPWLDELHSALDYLEQHDPGWGVLGCYGETRGQGSSGYVYSSGLGIIGAPLERPTPVQTLDEIVLVLRRSSGLRFDDSLPHFHFYGADICLRAQQEGKQNYAISAFCIHNSRQGAILPPEFYVCYWHFRRKWKSQLPVYTPCIQVTGSNLPLFRRKVWETYVRYIRRTNSNRTRFENGQQLVNKVLSSPSREQSV